MKRCYRPAKQLKRNFHIYAKLEYVSPRAVCGLCTRVCTTHFSEKFQHFSCTITIPTNQKKNTQSKLLSCVLPWNLQQHCNHQGEWRWIRLYAVFRLQCDPAIDDTSSICYENNLATMKCYLFTYLSRLTQYQLWKFMVGGHTSFERVCFCCVWIDCAKQKLARWLHTVVHRWLWQLGRWKWCV